MIFVELLHFLDALLTFIGLLVFIGFWLIATRYWIRLLIYNKQVRAKFVTFRYTKDKKKFYGVFEYNYRGRVYTGSTVHTLNVVDKAHINSSKYCTVYLCSLFPNKLCTKNYKDFSWIAPIGYIIYTAVIIAIIIRLFM